MDLFGPSIRVQKDYRISAELNQQPDNAYLPDTSSLVFVDEEQLEDLEGNSLATVADSSNCKVVVVSVVHVDPLKAEIFIDAYWDTEVNVNVEVDGVYGGEVSQAQTTLYALKAAVPNRPLSPTFNRCAGCGTSD